MKQTNITLPRPQAAQQRVIDESTRFNVLACGRRWGKTQLGIDGLVQKMLNGLPTGWFSPTYRHLSDTWRELCDVLDAVIADRSQQERRLDLIGGGVIEMWSLDTAGDAARGRRYARVSSRIAPSVGLLGAGGMGERTFFASQAHTMNTSKPSVELLSVGQVPSLHEHAFT